MNIGSILLSSRMPSGECERREGFITQLQIPPKWYVLLGKNVVLGEG